MNTTALTIGDFSVRQHDGLFSLNDLHKASGENKSQRPGEFLRLDPTKALIAEIETAGYPAVKTVEGRNGGTYACRELVIAYAAWINAAFHLKVIRVFLNATAPASAQKVITRQIKTRDDLSFTKRNAKGNLMNWVLPPMNETESWSDGIELGRRYFLEVLELAKVNPKEAAEALVFALSCEPSFQRPPGGFTGTGRGVEVGFAQAVAQYAVQGVKLEAEQRKVLGGVQ